MNKTSNQLFNIKTGNTLLLGVSNVAGGVQFAMALPDVNSCILHLYRKGQVRKAASIHLTEEYKIGGVFFVVLTGLKKPGEEKRSIAQLLQDEYEYTYEVNGREFVDPYAYQICGRSTWGKVLSEAEKSKVRAGFAFNVPDMEDDVSPKIPLDEMILYQMHVRGFTKHSSSKVAHKGTYAGIIEKIPYLQDLGINAVMLLPCYEFDEIMPFYGYGIPAAAMDMPGQVQKMVPVAVDASKKSGNDVNMTVEAKTKSERSARVDIRPQIRLNYWGYGADNNFYFAPKASYAADKNAPAAEFMEMVKALHKAGIEVLMDVYFAPGTNLFLMTECLRHWALHYHIDGFRVNQDVLPSYVVASDPILCNVKLLTAYWDKEMLEQNKLLGTRSYLAEYNDGFMNDVRRYLKGDEARVEPFVNRFKRNPYQCGVINYVAHVNGFTMMDMVSYDVKHNEDNGERGEDGTDYNYSWNCGVEGSSRKKTIVQKRKCQIRNAFLMLLASQGTPMILAGDEFGNSQKGNNNPYCQDNSTTWLNWKQVEQNADIRDYVKKLIVFRKEHPILHMKRELRMLDTMSCGYPDLSIHGTQAWYADFSPYNRMLGVMLCGQYVTLANGNKDRDIFIAFNMHWEQQSFDLPNLPEDKTWYLYLDTYEDTFYEIRETKKSGRRKKRGGIEQSKKTIVPPRSIVVYVSG